jgi:hypothetical protein
MMGIEPTTFGLGGRCSTIELHRLSYLLNKHCSLMHDLHLKNTNLILYQYSLTNSSPTFPSNPLLDNSYHRGSAK